MGGESSWRIWCVGWQGDDREDTPAVVSAPGLLAACERWAELLDAEGLSDAMAGVTLLVEGADGRLHRVELAGELSINWWARVQPPEEGKGSHDE